MHLMDPVRRQQPDWIQATRCAFPCRRPERGSTRRDPAEASLFLTNCCEVQNANNSMELSWWLFVLRGGNQGIYVEASLPVNPS